MLSFDTLQTLNLGGYCQVCGRRGDVLTVIWPDEPNDEHVCLGCHALAIVQALPDWLDHYLVGDLEAEVVCAIRRANAKELGVCYCSLTPGKGEDHELH